MFRKWIKKYIISIMIEVMKEPPDNKVGLYRIVKCYYAKTDNTYYRLEHLNNKGSWDRLEDTIWNTGLEHQWSAALHIPIPTITTEVI